MVDSLTHGLVGGFSWAVVTDVQVDRQRVIECIVCLGLAMSVDVDHFIAAKSFHLKVLTSLFLSDPGLGSATYFDFELTGQCFIFCQKFHHCCYLLVGAKCRDCTWSMQVGLSNEPVFGVSNQV